MSMLMSALNVLSTLEGLGPACATCRNLIVTRRCWRPRPICAPPSTATPRPTRGRPSTLLLSASAKPPPACRRALEAGGGKLRAAHAAAPARRLLGLDLSGTRLLPLQ